MSAIRKELQKQLFQTEEERLHTIIQLEKVDGKKKKRPTFLCIAVTLEHPISVRIYFVRSERDDVYKRKERYNLRELKGIDGVNPKKCIPDFQITFNDRTYDVVACSSDDKEEFIRELYKLSSHYLPIQMPDFCNVSLPVDFKEKIITAFDSVDSPDHQSQQNYQPITAREEADFRALLEKNELLVGDADILADILSNHLQSLDGANINSMLSCEAAVSQLLSSLDNALSEVEKLEATLNKCDDIFLDVRNSYELMEEKDSLAAVERKNKERLRQELMEYVVGLDAVTDAHIKTLEESRFDDPRSIAASAEAARAVAQFWNGRIAKPLLKMKSYEDRNNMLEVTDLFVDRLGAHLSALFNNLNDFSLVSDWHSLSIPKQSQRFHALAPLADLVGWLKNNKPYPYSVVVQRYVDATNLLYKKLFDRFFEEIFQQLKELNVNKKSENVTLSSKVSVESNIPPDFTSDIGNISKLIETVLGELGPVVEREQKFCTRFFHITPDILSHAEVASISSGDSSIFGNRNIDKLINEQIRTIMSPLFDCLNEHLRKFADAICRQNPSNVLVLFVIISKKVLCPQDPGSYFTVTFGSLLILVKRQFESYMENECRLYSEMKLNKRVRVGVLPNIHRFQQFVQNAEKIFADSERRADLEKWYIILCKSVIEGIQKISTNPNSKSPPKVVLLENYHQLYLTLSELKISCLDELRKQAKRDKEDEINSYVKESLGKPLEKVNIFFDNINNAINVAGIRPEEISYQPQFSRPELKKVISMYPAKEVKKGLELLYKTLFKHLGENSSLLQVVWRGIQEQFIKQLQGYQTIMADCYPGAKVDLDVSIDEILHFFSNIAQQH